MRYRIETIVVLRGTYRENVVIAKDGIRLLSLGARLEPPAAPEPNFCSEPGQPAAIGICVAGKFDPDTGEVLDPVDDVTVSGFHTRDFPDAGVLAYGALNATFAHNVAENDDEYGITAFVSTGTRMLFNRVSGADEAGFYIGDSPVADATLVGNVAEDSRFGILWRNAEGGSAVGNVIRGNTRACEQSDEGPALSGVGIALAGAHDNQISTNLITDNAPSAPTAFSGGVAVLTDFLGTAPLNNLVQGNVLLRNQPDLFWDGSGSGNVFRGNVCRTSDPAGLCGH